MSGNNGNGIPRELDRLQAFPLLTEATTATGSPSRPAGPGGAASLGQLVEGTLREVLAWRPRADDIKGFVAALDQSFEIDEVDGHTEWKWTPRSYTVQADMGAVTGAQASIYTRAKSALDQSIPLLNGLYALRADSDDQDADAARALVRAKLNELVTELGQVGGPRLQRVDAHFIALLGERRTDDPERVGGLLGLLRERLGLERRRINTIAEEQNLTNYLILVDHTIALNRTWVAQRHFFDRHGTDVFLGTQLVLLSRALGVVGDSVHVVYDALDSVYVRAAERQITQLPLVRHGKKEFRLTLAELLSWIATVALEEGPRAINEGGKDGVITLRPILEDLHRLTLEVLRIANKEPENFPKLPPGLFTPRSRVALEGLEASLEEASELAAKLRRAPSPRIDQVDPDEIVLERATQSVTVFIEGEEFQPDAKARLLPIIERDDDDDDEGDDNDDTRKPIMAKRVTFISPTALRARFQLSDDDVGLWRLFVANPDGGEGKYEQIEITAPDQSDESSSVSVQPPRDGAPPPPKVTVVGLRNWSSKPTVNKRSIGPDKFGTTETYGADEGLDTVVFALDNTPQPPEAYRVVVDGGTDAMGQPQQAVEGKTIRVFWPEANGKPHNIEPGTYTLALVRTVAGGAQDVLAKVTFTIK